MKMELNEALERLNRAGLIVEETTEDALARIAANSNEAIVEEIVEEIEKVRPVKNYYEVDPDDKGVTQQFEIVMENATWEVQFSRSGFSWGGNVYPWRIIQNNNGGFTKVAHSMSGLRSLMKKIKAIQSESVNENADDPYTIMRKKLEDLENELLIQGFKAKLIDRPGAFFVKVDSPSFPEKIIINYSIKDKSLLSATTIKC